MEFDVSRVYTAVNADELKIGSMVIVADTLKGLKSKVEANWGETTLLNIDDECSQNRFFIDSKSNIASGSYTLAYLVSEPEEKKLKWTDLNVGDIIRKGTQKSMVVAIDECHTTSFHVLVCDGCLPELNWLGSEDLSEWEKVEK